MSETFSADLLGTWAPPECPYKITYSHRAMDDIRLAVVDAFFSLPRGGAEIGGILLGKQEGSQVTILDYVALDCEHAFGPSFTLSPRDLESLSTLLEQARTKTPDLQPAGWYHSHTRSEIFLSEADVEIHNRYFPAPWQVALVLKPHTFQPTRAGYFFRGADGTFRTEASYEEFVLRPLPMRTMPSGVIPPPAESGNIRLETAPTGNIITMPAQLTPASAVDPAPPAPVNGQTIQVVAEPTAANLEAKLEPPVTRTAAEPEKPAAPVVVHNPVVHNPEVKTPVDEVTVHFTDLGSKRRWNLPALLGLLAILAIGVSAFGTRRMWMPRIWPAAPAKAVQTPVAKSLGLVLTDHEGQLQIVWDKAAPALQAATKATLEISTGSSAPTATRLDAAQLQTGSFSYKRETERVDVVLSVDGPPGELGANPSVSWESFPNRSHPPSTLLRPPSVTHWQRRWNG